MSKVQPSSLLERVPYPFLTNRKGLNKQDPNSRSKLRIQLRSKKKLRIYRTKILGISMSRVRFRKKPIMLLENIVIQ